MRNEFLLVRDPLPDFPLSESIDLSREEGGDGYLICNREIPGAEVYAPEIDFYLDHTLDVDAEKIRTVALLFELRAMAFDFATDFEEEVEVGPRVLIIGNEQQIEETVNSLEPERFELFAIRPDEVERIEGTIGDLRVAILRGGKELTLAVDQVLWFNAPEEAFCRYGVYDPAIDGLSAVRKRLEEATPVYRFRHAIEYDPQICQYRGRRGKEGETFCGDCAAICPTNAIVRDDSERELRFSPVDCERCGGCISVCPSGALDFRASPRSYLYEASLMAKGKTFMLIPESMDLQDVNIALPAGVIPLMIGGRKFLHEAHFLTLFQHSGTPVVLYTDFLSKGTRAALRMVNDIGRRRYGRDLVEVAMFPEELADVFEKLAPVDEATLYSINEEGMRKREIFMHRLAYLIGDRDLGTYEGEGEYLHYGSVTIDAERCTLCLSCVGACNVAAITAHPEDNTLRFDAVCCTDCGYCEAVCPEPDTLHVVRDRLELRPETFGQRVMARDELFACVECGREFAPKKTIERIAQQLAPVFSSDPVKLKTLYCCEHCKPKVMLKAQAEMWAQDSNVERISHG